MARPSRRFSRAWLDPRASTAETVTDTRAEARVTLRVPRGCVLGLVGVNGSGKTTLLKHVLGLYRAQRGQVRQPWRSPMCPATVLT